MPERPDNARGRTKAGLTPAIFWKASEVGHQQRRQVTCRKYAHPRRGTSRRGLHDKVSKTLQGHEWRQHTLIPRQVVQVRVAPGMACNLVAGIVRVPAGVQQALDGAYTRPSRT